MHRILIAFALVLALALPLPASAETVTGLPVIVDGDSLRFPGTDVRLEGIDAPEWDQSCQRNGATYQCGQEATAALRALIAGRPVTCVGVPQKNGTERDIYGRLLAECRAGDTLINARMVEGGHALAFRRYSVEYVPQEDRARAAGVGLWAGPHGAPWDWRRAKKVGRKD
mgnify:CR=1 FL=1